MMESQNYITYLLLFVLIGIVLIIINGLYAKNNGKNSKENIESFYTITTPMIPIVTSPLVPIIKENNDSLKKLRFSWMDNQDRLNNISTRINNVKKDLVSLMESQNTMYSASGTMTFY